LLDFHVMKNDTEASTGVSLVIGADGLIGRALADYLVRSGGTVIETTRQTGTISEKRTFLDLSRDLSKWSPPCKCSVAYVCAAVTSLEKCRAEPAKTALINVQHTVALAGKLVKSGTFVVFPSTNLVFDGSLPYRKADDAVCPVTEYGRQKAEAEKQILALGNMAAVVRFTKVQDPETPLIKGWLNTLRNKESIYPFSDMVVAPLSVDFAVDVLHRVGGTHSAGIFQASAAKDVTYAQVGRYIARRIHASAKLVQPVKSGEAGPSLEAVPRHTTLDTTRLRAEFGLEPPDVWSTLDAVFGLSG
jgi:dTDP-4-dehydrorhamnose reductase